MIVSCCCVNRSLVSLPLVIFNNVIIFAFDAIKSLITCKLIHGTYYLILQSFDFEIADVTANEVENKTSVLDFVSILLRSNAFAEI